MRGGWRRIGMMALGILALLGGAGALRPAPARAQEPRPESGCRTPWISDWLFPSNDRRLGYRSAACRGSA